MNATNLVLLGLCGVNLAALIGLLLGGRRGARPAAAPPARPRRQDDDLPPRVVRSSAAPTLEDLVREAEAAERAAARGESRLAADLARWRERAAGKNPPGPAADGRRATGGVGW